MPGSLDTCINNVYEDGNIPASSGTPPKRVLLRDAFEVEISETAAADDALDDFLGLFMVEAASAVDVVSAGRASGVVIDEPATALDSFDAAFAVGISADVSETATAASAQDGTVTAAVAGRAAMIDGAFVNSGATSRQANAYGVMVNV